MGTVEMGRDVGGSLSALLVVSKAIFRRTARTTSLRSETDHE
jgi:hypothetical protein